MTNERFVKFFNKWIDLEMVIGIEDACWIDRMGFGGWWTQCKIICQLPPQHGSDTQHEIVIWGSFDDSEKVFHYDEKDGRNSRHKLVMKDGSIVDPHDKPLNFKESDILAVYRIQQKVDELVEKWKQYNYDKASAQKE